jgi:hypothetical protein
MSIGRFGIRVGVLATPVLHDTAILYPLLRW